MRHVLRIQSHQVVDLLHVLHVVITLETVIQRVSNMWVLLDFDGSPIRYYDFPAEGTVEVKEKTYTYNELLEIVGECLL